jgi:hypothetical protein
MLTAAASAAVTFDFEPPTFSLGTQYGPPAGDTPGDVVATVGGAEMLVDEFTQGTFTGFNLAEIAGHPGPPTSYFPVAANPTQSLTINNIGVGFDFSGLSYDVTEVTFDYVDLGGTENLDVNELGRQELGQLSFATSYPNFTVNVSETAVTGGLTGTVSIVADPGNAIDTLLIGGQEFGLDNLTAVPEPAALTLLGLGGLLLACRRG